VDWVGGLKKGLSAHLPKSSLSNEQWTAVETSYWRQWDWSTEGTIKRRDPTAKMSVFDLMVAARYAGDTFLHWRGGLLSIAQWSRILAITSADRLEIMREPAVAALGHLGFPELVEALPRPEKTESQMSTVKATTRSREVPPPMVALSILRKGSPLLAWRPDAAVRAFALRPREQDEADARIAHHGTGADRRDSLVLPYLTRAYSTERDIAKLHLIEVPPGRTVRDAARDLSQFARTIGWIRVYFAEKVLTGSERSLLLSARDIRQLAEDVKRKFPDLFLRELMSAWARWYADGYHRFHLLLIAAGIEDWRVVKWLERLFAPTDRSAP
jgi:hypothetical protein